MFFLLMIIFVGCQASTKVEEALDSYFQKLISEGSFNGTVLVSDADKILYENALGYSRAKQAESLAIGDLFGLGSIYKEFPAVAIMKLQEAGELSLEDPVSKFLKDLPDWSNEVQIRHLLQYSSGLPRVDFGKYFQTEEGARQKDIVADLSTLEELAAEPGSKYIYSNYNPFILVEIVKEITGQDFESFLVQDILKPLRIDGITVENKFPYENQDGFAMPFNNEHEGDDIKYELMTICASTTGLDQWMKMLSNFEIISKESMQELSMTFSDDEGEESPLGHVIWDSDLIKSHVHQGSSGNYECLISNNEEIGVRVILLTNQKNGNLFEIVDEVEKILNTEE